MTTADQFFHFSKNFHFGNDNQHCNLTLYQKCSIPNPVQSYSKTNKDKNDCKKRKNFAAIPLKNFEKRIRISIREKNGLIYWDCSNIKIISDSTVSENNEQKGKLKTWNKFSKISTFGTLNSKDEAAKKSWKMKDRSYMAANSSTLSLHITAYENSFDQNGLSNSFCGKKEKNSIVSTAAKNVVIHNPFEFPRQQQNDKKSEPEISQFQASQKLLNPNEALKKDSVTRFKMGDLSSTLPKTSMNQQPNDDRRYIDNRWVCLKDGDFLEYKENEWMKVDEDEIEELNDKWNKTHPLPAAPQLQREVDGRWIYPSGDKFLEFVDNQWKEVDASLTEEIRVKYEAADPYRKVVNGIPMKFNLHLQQWLPEVEVNDDFVAMYQANYGVAIDYSKLPPSEKELKMKELEEKQKAKEERKRKAAEMGQEEGWTEISDERDTHVYVSNLPTDITDEEFMEFMEKVGVIMKDPRTNKPKIKLYKTPEGDLKGDGTCCYVKRESVELALTILDGWDLNKHKVKVEKAKFQMKGEFDPSKKKKKMTVEQKKKFMEKQNKAFEWEPEKPRNYRPPSDRTVILKNVFGLDEMIKDVTLALDLKEIIKERCERFGKIIKIVVYENHPEGVVSVSYNTVEEADYCVELLNRGIMRHRKIEAANWDGKTKFKVKESEEDQKRRDQEWKTFLEDEEEDPGNEKEAVNSTTQNDEKSTAVTQSEDDTHDG